MKVRWGAMRSDFGLIIIGETDSVVERGRVHQMMLAVPDVERLTCCFGTAWPRHRAMQYIRTELRRALEIH